MIDEKRYLTVTKAAKRCHCLRGSVHHAIESGKLQSQRIGGIVLVDVAAVDEWNRSRLAKRKLRQQLKDLRQKIKEHGK